MTEVGLTRGGEGRGTAGDVALRRLGLAAGFVLAGLLAALAFPAPLQPGLAAWHHATFLYDPSLRFTDLTDSIAQTRFLDPYYRPPGGLYFPFCYWVLSFARTWSREADILGFLEFSAIGYLLACLAGAVLRFGPTRRSLWAALFLAVMVFAGYPLLIALDRGNFEAIVGWLCFLALLALDADRPVLGALLLAASIALRGYPLALCVLFAARARPKASLLAVLAAAILTLAGAAALYGGMGRNLAGFHADLRLYQAEFAMKYHGMHYSADPYNGLRVLGLWALHLWPRPVWWFLNVPLIHGYKFFSGSVLLACCAYALLAPAPFHRRVLAATLGMLLYPDLVNDYKLLQLLPVVFFMATDETPWSRADKIAFGALLSLLVPKNYYFLFLDVSVSCLISPALMLLLLATLASDGPAWTTVASRMLRPREVWNSVFARDGAAGRGA